MNVNILAGAKIVLISSDELIRSEAFATMAIEGWEFNTIIPKDIESLPDIFENGTEGFIVAILEQSIKNLDTYVQMLRKNNISDSQIVIAYPSGSLVHRAYIRSGIEGIPFSLVSHATGVKIGIESLPTALQAIWHRWHSLQLEKEVKDFMNSSTLSLIKELVGLTDTSLLKERAHLACSLANHINSDMLFRKRVIRLSLFCDLIKSNSWKNITDESRNLWVIKDLLEKRSNYLSAGLEISISWPSDMPIEIAIVESIILFQKNSSAPFQNYLDLIDRCTKSLSLENRVSMRQAINACFVRVRRQTHERKSTAAS